MTDFLKQGPGILESDEQKKGLLPRVVKGLFDSLNPSEEDMTYSIKLSMVPWHLLISSSI